MFERYTEKSRRVIFFARYEASQFGSPYIETEHILLGLLREDKALTNRFLRAHVSVEAIRKQIEGHTTIREKVSTSVDLPLSNENKRVLAYAAEEAERLSHKHIGTEHLLLGLLREEKCFAAEILHERGLRLSSIREELVRTPHQPTQRESTPLLDSARDLTQNAAADEFDPLVGRIDELQAVLLALATRTRNSVVLVGEPGIGKTAVVEALAQRIANGSVPPALAHQRILAIDLGLLAAGATRSQFAERMSTLVEELRESRDAILFFREMTGLVGSGPEGSLDAINILRPALARGDVQCIVEATTAAYEGVLRKIPWFESCSRTVRLPCLKDEEILKVLQGQKDRFEKYHTVSYADDALQCATQYAKGYAAKAIDVMDTAGTLVKLRKRPLPEDVIEGQKRIRFIEERMNDAVGNHEFEKARFYAAEERKERAKLRALLESYQIDELSTTVVRLQDMESAIALAGR
jgi:ATP-dependent Clp protease ATP-binding subunit ClpC